MAASEEGVKKDSRFPWGENPAVKAVKAWSRQKRNFERWMHDRQINYNIDEIALLFSGDYLRNQWLRDAVVGEGVKMFNASHDRVRTEPFETTYGVDYAFLEVPGLGMRVEAMVLDGGPHESSPLHEAILSQMLDKRPHAVHLSFKVENPDRYEAVCERLTKVQGAEVVQRCRSAYGQFSYWKIQPLWSKSACLYLKPRVNIRDSVYDADDAEYFASETPDRSPFDDNGDLEPDRGEFGMPTLGALPTYGDN